jgi:hypothetical protein
MLNKSKTVRNEYSDNPKNEDAYASPKRSNKRERRTTTPVPAALTLEEDDFSAEFQQNFGKSFKPEVEKARQEIITHLSTEEGHSTDQDAHYFAAQMESLYTVSTKTEEERQTPTGKKRKAEPPVKMEKVNLDSPKQAKNQMSRLLKSSASNDEEHVTEEVHQQVEPMQADSAEQYVSYSAPLEHYERPKMLGAFTNFSQPSKLGSTHIGFEETISDSGEIFYIHGDKLPNGEPLYVYQSTKGRGYFCTKEDYTTSTADIHYYPYIKREKIDFNALLSKKNSKKTANNFFQRLEDISTSPTTHEETAQAEFDEAERVKEARRALTIKLKPEKQTSRKKDEAPPYRVGVIKKAEKETGTHDGFIAITPSKSCDYMAKKVTQTPFRDQTSKDRLNITLGINEFVMSEIYHQTLETGRVPQIDFGLHKRKIYALSRMFQTFAPLSSLIKNGRITQHHDYFERLLVTSLLTGNPDFHPQNLGLIDNNKLVQIDFGRSLFITFRNGQEVLDFIDLACQKFSYDFKLSAEEVINHIDGIEKDGFSKLHISLINRFEKIPTKVGYRTGRILSLAATSKPAECFFGHLVAHDNNNSFRTLDDYLWYATCVVNTNFKALIDARNVLKARFAHLETKKENEKDSIERRFVKSIKVEKPTEPVAEKEAITISPKKGSIKGEKRKSSNFEQSKVFKTPKVLRKALKKEELMSPAYSQSSKLPADASLDKVFQAELDLLNQPMQDEFSPFFGQSNKQEASQSSSKNQKFETEHLFGISTNNIEKRRKKREAASQDARNMQESEGAKESAPLSNKIGKTDIARLTSFSPFSPEKNIPHKTLHENATKVADKTKGIHPGIIAVTPSKNQVYVGKHFTYTPDKNSSDNPVSKSYKSVCLTEFMTSAIYKLTLGCERVPQIDLGTYSDSGRKKFMLFSKIIDGFSTWEALFGSGAIYPTNNFASALFTSLLCGNVDINRGNIGVSKGQLVSIDFGLSLGITINSGQKFLEYIDRIFAHQKYNFQISAEEAIEHIDKIEALGIGEINKCIALRAKELESAIPSSEIFPVDITIYKPESYFSNLLEAVVAPIRFENIGQYCVYASTILKYNFDALIEAGNIMKIELLPENYGKPTNISWSRRFTPFSTQKCEAIYKAEEEMVASFLR